MRQVRRAVAAIVVAGTLLSVIACSGREGSVAAMCMAARERSSDLASGDRSRIGSALRAVADAAPDSVRDAIVAASHVDSNVDAVEGSGVRVGAALQNAAAFSGASGAIELTRRTVADHCGITIGAISGA